MYGIFNGYRNKCPDCRFLSVSCLCCAGSPSKSLHCRHHGNGNGGENPALREEMSWNCKYWLQLQYRYRTGFAYDCIPAYCIRNTDPVSGTSWEGTFLKFFPSVLYCWRQHLKKWNQSDNYCWKGSCYKFIYYFRRVKNGTYTVHTVPYRYVAIQHKRKSYLKYVYSK